MEDQTMRTPHAPESSPRRTGSNATAFQAITLKSQNQNRNLKIRRQILDFIADKEISDSKNISKAIGLKPSRTRDYLKELVDEGLLEIEGEYKNRKYKRKLSS